MEAYQRDGKWYVRARGGRIGRELLAAEERGPFYARPEAGVMWHITKETYNGRESTRYTLFHVGETQVFTLVQTDWYSTLTYSTEVSHETFTVVLEPPESDYIYTWTAQGWERIQDGAATR